ncbi:hypothetical protein [Streptomyces sp. cmx-4-9]|uniref:hypothetical protein n=1 Tax=Streptomyces sp. cmx-4-9 TaxID=2790941 RepID=UPI003980785C
MVQGFRPTHWLACAVLAAAALTPAASAVAAAACPYVAQVREPGEDDGHPDLAGSPAGVGRERPGRPAAAPANPEAVAAGRPLHPRPRTEPAAPPRAPRPADPGTGTRTDTGTGTERGAGTDRGTGTHREQGTDRGTGTGTERGTDPGTRRPAHAIGTGPNERAADLAAHMLPLGTGLAMMGVGLGYLGMRLRKGL